MRRAMIVLACLLTSVVVFAMAAQAGGDGTVAILMPGAGGAVPIDFLMRNRASFTRAGIRTVVTSSPSKAAALSKSERAHARSVVIVAMSRGVIHAAQALAAGAQVSKAVFVSGNFKAVMSILGTPAKLPSTLVVHHRHDRCKYTTPRLVEPFRRWARGKVRVAWINTRGAPAPDPCGPFGAHGYFRQDGPAVAAIIAYIR